MKMLSSMGGAAGRSRFSSQESLTERIGEKSGNANRDTRNYKLGHWTEILE